MSKRCPNIDSRICANCSYRETCNVQSGEQQVSWGNVSGDISKQQDLRNLIDELRASIRQEMLSAKEDMVRDYKDRLSKLDSDWLKRFDDGFAGMGDRIDRVKRLSLLSSLPKFRWNGTRLFLANDGVSFDEGRELRGESARSVFTSIVFRAGNDEALITTPTGGSFNDPVPAGWSDGIPERTTDNPTIYMSKRKFTSDGVGQDRGWSTPVVAYDSQYTDICFHPAKSDGSTPSSPSGHGKQGDNTSTWHDTGNSNDVWMAISYRDMRSNGWSAWSISKIKGENGKDGDPGKKGQSILVSTVFKASVTKPATPTGGYFDNPVPDGWSDGIPDVSSMRTSIWMSKRKFTSDEEGQDSAWSEPVVACDTVNFDVCFHKATSDGNPPDAPTKRGTQDDPDGWHDKGTSEDVWMATCSSSMRNNNPVWSITKIKGEKGDEGDTPVPSMGDDGILSWKWKGKTDLPELPISRCLMGPTMVPSVNESTGIMTWSKITNPLNIPSDAKVKGLQGDKGNSWKPSVDSDGKLTWSLDSSTTVPTEQVIKGPKGDTGPAGADGKDGMSIEKRGAWAANTYYAVGDMVFCDVKTAQYSGVGYFVCISAHTSKTSHYQEQTLNGTTYKNLNPEYWELRRIVNS